MELWRKGTAGTTGDCLYRIEKGIFPTPIQYTTSTRHARILLDIRTSSHNRKTSLWIPTGVRQKWKKPSYLVWMAQGTLDKGCSRYWIGGPTGSGKTLVAAVQCRREVSAFSVPEVLVMASCISRCKVTIFKCHGTVGMRLEQIKGEAAKDYKGEVIVGMSIGEVAMPSE